MVVLARTCKTICLNRCLGILVFMTTWSLLISIYFVNPTFRTSTQPASLEITDDGYPNHVEQDYQRKHSHQERASTNAQWIRTSTQPASLEKTGNGYQYLNHVEQDNQRKHSHHERAITNAQWIRISTQPASLEKTDDGYPNHVEQDYQRNHERASTNAQWMLPLPDLQRRTTVPKRQWMQPLDEGNSMSETHAPNCRYHVLNTGTIYKGDIVKIRIDTRDKYNQPRIVGGDFWYARLESNYMPMASTAGTVTDYNNGTYLVLFLAAWTGPANINIILEHPSDAAEFIKGVWWHTDPKVYWQAIYQSPQNPSFTRTVTCTILSSGIWENKCIYPHPSAIGRTSFICLKPQGLPCSAIVQTHAHSEMVEARVNEIVGYKRFLFEGVNYHQEISGDTNTLYFKESPAAFTTDRLQKCQPNAPTVTFKGYWMDYQWHPLDYLKYNCWNNPSMVAECLRNKEVHIMGDSNGREYFKNLIQLLPPEPPARRLMAHHDHRYQYFTKYNITMTFEFHPEAIMGHWINFHQNYIVDFLDQLHNPSCNYVIILSTWAHFVQWRPDALEERLRLLREAVDRLLLRCPDVPVIVKSPHPRDHDSYFRARIQGSDILLNEIRKMLRKIFANSGVFYFDVWDMNLAFPGRKDVHMPDSVIKEELFMILSYICDSMCEQ